MKLEFPQKPAGIGGAVRGHFAAFLFALRTRFGIMPRAGGLICYGIGGDGVKTSYIVAVLITAALACAEAQWLNHRDPRIPRTRDGRPNLSAPAPRLNGRPDLSGLWEAERT